MRELELARLRLKEWFKAFPICDVAISNHGLRWLSRAYDAFIPSQLIKPYKEILDAPSGWKWHEEIKIKSKHPWRVIHGMGYSGVGGARNAAIDSGTSTVIGHLHSWAGVSYLKSGQRDRTIWSMNVGCLMSDESTMANSYAKHARHKGILSCGVVLNDGKLPVVVPYDGI